MSEPSQSAPAAGLSPGELATERSRGRYAGVAAILAGVLFPVGLIWSQVASRHRPEHNEPAELRFFHRHAGELLASSALRSLALLLLAVVAFHLYRAIKARNPDLNQIVLVLSLLGPLGLAVAGFAHDVYLASAAADFTGRHFQTIQGAKDLVRGPVAVVTVGLSIGCTLALAFWFVIASLNAMRVGLLSRFMGVLGVIVGPAFVFGLAPLVLTFWLVAIGLLFLGRWPRGLPPAWVEGKALPWPTATRVRRKSVGEVSGSSNGEVEPVGPGVRKAPDGDEESPAQKRRKRKRRQ